MTGPDQQGQQDRYKWYGACPGRMEIISRVVGKRENAEMAGHLYPQFIHGGYRMGTTALYDHRVTWFMSWANARDALTQEASRQCSRALGDLTTAKASLKIARNRLKLAMALPEQEPEEAPEDKDNGQGDHQ